MHVVELTRLQFPPDFDETLAAVRTINLEGLEMRPGTESVLAYAEYERLPSGFPRPEEHIVIADYIVCLPVVATDLSLASEHYGRVIAYCGGDFWIVADSLSEFAARLRQHQESALYGR